ncbi:unnamed protein product [Pelagomonas calceolata]|uniref:SAP domain-containing protein n=1 Tax=Pelagomonas calceolata TaxID=35677 RepID=A0A8J2SM08_9STRA|nr:unnamed protein product [Pelagomonas calceolata]
MGKNRRSTVFLSTKEEEEKEPTAYYHDLEATHDDRDEERRRLRLKQGKLLPRDPWGPGEFVSSCALQERATPKSWAAPPNTPKALKKFFDEVTDVKRFGGSSHKPDAKFGETREAHNFFVDWECRGHKFAFDAGVSFLTTVDRGCIYLICGELVGEEGFGSIRNLSRRAPQVLFDRGMGEYGWAQELEENEWDELLSRLGLEDVEPADFVACCLQWIGSDNIDHFRWGHAPCYVQPGRLDRCPLPVLDAALRLCGRVSVRKSSSVSPLTPLKPLCRHLDDEGNDVAERADPVSVDSKGARRYGKACDTPPPAPATPATPSVAGGSFGVSLRRGRRAKPRFSANPRKMAVETATPVRGSITLKDGTRAPKPDIVPESERNPEPTQPIDIMKMPVKDLRAALAQRGLETKGLKKVLQKRLLDALGVPDGASLEFKGS